jgi:ribonuclease PH
VGKMQRLEIFNVKASKQCEAKTWTNVDMPLMAAEIRLRRTIKIQRTISREIRENLKKNMLGDSYIDIKGQSLPFCCYVAILEVTSR